MSYPETVRPLARLTWMRTSSLALSLFFFGTLAASAVTPPESGPHIPSVHGTTFSNGKVDLPEALHGKVGILIVGFTQNSRESVTVWGKKLAADFYDSSKVAYYELPMLAAVPKMLRGMVAGSIRSTVSDRGRPHVLPITENEPVWRSLVHYSDPDTPYILVVDEHGTVRWQAQGPATDATYTAMKQQVDTLLPR
jgi:hypothetical protein